MGLNSISFLLPILHILKYAHAQGTPCATPDAPQNGFVEGVQPVIKYKCDYGYKLSGRDTNYCDVAGSWTYATPSCNVVTCPKLTAPTNGRMYPSSPDVTFDTKVIFDCDFDYSLNGAAQVVCGENGTWEPGPLPTCNETSCEIPNEPGLIVEVEYDSHLPGGYIYYSCSDEWQYLFPNVTKAKCRPSGEWRPSLIPACFGQNPWPWWKITLLVLVGVKFIGGICACVCKKMCKSSNRNEGGEASEAGEAALPLKDVNSPDTKDQQPVNV